MPDKKSFEEMLKENLELYVQEPEHSHHTFFQATREITLARYALSKQAEFYARAVEIYTELLDRWIATYTDNPVETAKLLTNILHAVEQIEQKSAHLIESVRNVTSLLGQAVNIDIDKAALSQMILRLPNLIRTSIEKVSSDPDLAERISTSVDTQLSELMIACRFSGNAPFTTPQESSQGILLNEYNQMINTIPSQPSLQ